MHKISYFAGQIHSFVGLHLARGPFVVHASCSCLIYSILSVVYLTWDFVEKHISLENFFQTSEILWHSVHGDALREERFWQIFTKMKIFTFLAQKQKQKHKKHDFQTIKLDFCFNLPNEVWKLMLQVHFNSLQQQFKL